MLSNRQRAAFFKLVAGLGVVGLGIYLVNIGGIREAVGVYGTLTIVFVLTLLTLTAIHITAMDYHRSRSVIGAVRRATVGEHGWLSSATILLFTAGLLVAEFTNGQVQLFILVTTTAVALLGVAADLTVRASRVVRSYL